MTSFASKMVPLHRSLLHNRNSQEVSSDDWTTSMLEWMPVVSWSVWATQQRFRDQMLHDHIVRKHAGMVHVSNKKERNVSLEESMELQWLRNMQNENSLYRELIEDHGPQQAEWMEQLYACHDVQFRLFSSCTRMQHVEYLELQRKKDRAIKSGFPKLLALTPDEHATLDTLNEIIYKEQKTFARLEEKKYRSIFAGKISRWCLPNVIEAWLKEHIERSKSRATKAYSQFYIPCSVFDLKQESPDNSNQATSMKYRSTLYQLGKVMEMKSENSFQNAKLLDLPAGPIRVSSRISDDECAKKLMLKHDIHFGMTCSTLARLFDCHGGKYDEEWNIPVEVSEVVIPGKKIQKLTFLDKPLPLKTINRRQALAKYSKASMRSFFGTGNVAINFGGDKPTETGATWAETETHTSNLVYTLWELHGLRILLRCRIHGATKTGSGNEWKSCDVQAKIDFQDEREQLTRSELARWWIHTWARGESRIRLGRINMMSMTLRTTEEYSLASLLSQDVTFSLDTIENFSCVSQILHQLSELPIGEYIVMNKKESSQIKIYNNVVPDEQEGLLDLHAWIAGSGQLTEEMDFVLPHWNITDRIPYTFPAARHCSKFYQERKCPRMDSGERCRFIHIAPSKGKSDFLDMYSLQNESYFPKLSTKPSRSCKLPTTKYCMSYMYTGVCQTQTSGKNCPLLHVNIEEALDGVAEEIVHRKKERKICKPFNKQSKKKRFKSAGC